MVDVIYSGIMLGKTLRFIRAPGDAPRFPYVVANDLAACLSLNRKHRRILEKMVSDDVMTGTSIVVLIDDRPERCISHSAVRGIIDAVEIINLRIQGEFEKASAIDHDIATSSNIYAYAQTAKEAMDVLTAGMSPPEGLAFMMEAFKAEQGGAA